MKKTVDVIIPAYNAEKFIERTLKSVVSQTHLPEKIIVVDDGSTDETVNVIKNFKKKSKVEIDIYRQENRGPNAARNVGLKNSTSEFVAFLDADDLWEKEKLEKQLRVFENTKFEKLGIVYCGYELVDESGEKLRKKNIAPRLKGKVFYELLKSNLISGSPSTVLMKKECLGQTGLFDEILRGSEDWDMWLRVAKDYDFDYVDEPLIFVADMPVSNSKNYESMLINRVMFINKWIDEIKKSKELVTYHRNKLISGAVFCKINKPPFKIKKTINKYISEDTKKILFKGKEINVLRYILSILSNRFFKRQF